MAFSFDDETPKSNRYGNSRMDNLLAGEMKFTDDDEPRQQQQAPPPPGREARERRRQSESFQNERDYSTTQQRNLLDVTEQNTIANSKQNNNLGYDPSEFMVMDENTVSSNVNDVNLFIRVMLGLILFFQIFIIFRLFTQSTTA